MSKEVQIYLDNEHKQPASPVTKAEYVTLEGGQSVETFLSNDIREETKTDQTNDLVLDKSAFESPVDLVIKGNTIQNILPEPSSEFITHSKPEFNIEDGQVYPYPVNMVDGDMVDLRIQGQTIKNLAFETSPIEYEVSQEDNFLTNYNNTDTRYDIQDNYDYAVIKGKSVNNLLAETCGTPAKTVENERDIIPDANSVLAITTTDGFYHENILYGKTLKNELVPYGTEIEETHESKRYSDNLGIQVSNNTNFDTAVIKGKTLVNLTREDATMVLGSNSYSSGVIVNAEIEVNSKTHTNVKITVITAGSRNAYVSLSIKKQMLKPSTTYFCKILNYTNPKNITLDWVQIKSLGSGTVYSDGYLSSTKLEYNTFKVSTKSDISGINNENNIDIVFECSKSTQVYDVGDVISAYGIIMCEYQEGMENWDWTYFDGMQSVVNPSIGTYSKNLLDPSLSYNRSYGGTIDEFNNARGPITFTINNTEKYPQVSIQLPDNLVKFLRGKKCRLSANITVSQSNLLPSIQFQYTSASMGTAYSGVNKNLSDGLIATKNRILRFPYDMTLCKIQLVADNTGGTTETGTVTWENLQLSLCDPDETEQSPVIYDSSYNSNTSSSTITLNGLPNGVCDELDLVTGRYVKRVTKLVLDGTQSIDWVTNIGDNIDNLKTSNYYRIMYNPISTITGVWEGQGFAVSDKVAIHTSNAYYGLKDMSIAISGAGRIYLTLGSDKISTNTISAVNTYLSANPITLYCQLASPIILYPGDADYPANLVTSVPKSYSTSTILLSSDSLTPSFKYSLKTDNYYDIQGIDTTSTYTTYNITGNFLNQTNLTTNYTGTLDRGTSKRIVVEGTNPMVISGSKINDVPYFIGLKNFKTKQITLPDGNTGYSVVRNTGKNLLHVGYGRDDLEKQGISLSFDKTAQTFTVNGTCNVNNNCFSISKFSKMMIKGKRYVLSIYLVSGTAETISFRVTDADWKYSMGQTLGTGASTNYFSLTFLTTIKYIDASIRIDAGKTFDNAVFKMMLEELPSGGPTAYEPYFENEVYVDEELELRSLPDGTCDELDLNTGILTRRVGNRIIVDGFNDSTFNLKNESKGLVLINYQHSSIKSIEDGKYSVYSNYLPTLNMYNTWTAGKYGISQASNGSYLQLSLEIEKAGNTVSDIRSYIKAHPLEVQYVLTNEERTQLSLKTKGNYKKQIFTKTNFKHEGGISPYFTPFSLSISTVYNNPNDTYFQSGFSTEFKFKKQGMDRSYCENLSFYLGGPFININNNRLNGTTINDASTYLAKNPVNLYYRSNESISITDINKPIYINKGHLIQSSDIACSVKYSLPNENYYYLRDLKPNTNYLLKYVNNATINNTVLTNLTSFSTTSISNNYALINGRDNLPVMYEGTPNVKYTTNYLEDVCYNIGDKILLNTGKNLFNPNETNLHQNGARITEKDNNNVTIAQITNPIEGNYYYTGTKVNIKNGEKYTLSIGNCPIAIALYNKTNNTASIVITESNSSISKTITSDGDWYILLYTYRGSGDVSLNDTFTYSNIQLEEGSTATAYEPYKANVINQELSNKLKLRSLPDGTCDTFNAKTGVITRRVGVMSNKDMVPTNVFQSQASDTTILVQFQLLNNSVPSSAVIDQNIKLINCSSNRFAKHFTPSQVWSPMEHESISIGGSNDDYNRIQIRINKKYFTKELTHNKDDRDAIQAYIRSLPEFFFYFKLKTPIYETVTTSSTNLDNTAFANGHTMLTNNGVCPDIMYGMKTNNYYSLPTLAKGYYTVNTNGSYIINGETKTSEGKSYLAFDTVTEKKLFCDNPITLAEGNLEYLPMVTDIDTTTNASVTFSKANGSEPITINLSGYALNSLPNGVCDEIDIKNGMHIQRVGVVTLDGTENWVNSTGENSEFKFYILLPNIKKMGNYLKSIISTSLITVSNNGAYDINFITSYNDGSNNYPNENWLYVRIRSLVNTNMLKSYLVSNPITVYYELAQPIVTPITDINLPKVYAGGKVTVTADNVLPKVKYRYPTNNSYVVDKLLPNKTYTLRTEWAKDFYIGGTLYERPNSSYCIYEFTTSTSLNNRFMLFKEAPTNGYVSSCLLLGNKNSYKVIPNKIENLTINAPYLDTEKCIIRSTGKNLFDLSRMKEVSYENNFIDNYHPYWNMVSIDLKNNSLITKLISDRDHNYYPGYGYRLYVEPNKEYIIHFDYEGDGKGLFNISSNPTGSTYYDNRIMCTENKHYYAIIKTSTGHFNFGCVIENGTYGRFSNICIYEYNNDTTEGFEPFSSVVTQLTDPRKAEEREHIELLSIPGTDVRDEIIIDPNTRDIKLVKRIGKIQLTREMNWKLTQGYIYLNGKNNIDQNSKTDYKERGSLISDLLTTSNSSNTNEACTDISKYINNIAISIGLNFFLMISYDSLNMRDGTRTGIEAKDLILHIIDKYKPIVYYELDQPEIITLSTGATPKPIAKKDGHILLETKTPANIELSYAINQTSQIDNVNSMIAEHDTVLDEIYRLIDLYMGEYITLAVEKEILLAQDITEEDIQNNIASYENGIFSE